MQNVPCSPIAVVHVTTEKHNERDWQGRCQKETGNHLNGRTLRGEVGSKHTAEKDDGDNDFARDNTEIARAIFGVSFIFLDHRNVRAERTGETGPRITGTLQPCIFLLSVNANDCSETGSEDAANDH